MTLLPVALILALGAFTQGLTGFGSALVSMPILTALIGLQTAAPLMALAGLLIEIFLLVRYRRAMHPGTVARLVFPAMVGAPLGVWMAGRVDQELLEVVLGVLVAGYAMYALLGRPVPEVRTPSLTYGAGLLAGLLGGIFNTAGPPVIILGDSQRWPPAEFKGNLQGFFMANTLFVVASHAVTRHLTAHIWTTFAWVAPGVLLGMWLGLRLDGRLDPVRFRRLVLALLTILGGQMVLNGVF